MLVIPSLGDSVAEDGMQALFGGSGIERYLLGEARAREEAASHWIATDRDQTEDDEMDIDEDDLEADCISTDTPSASRPGSPSSSRHSSLRRITLGNGASKTENKEVDLAGVCFDPKGCWLYVASTSGVAEWSVTGADKRWWSGGDWV